MRSRVIAAAAMTLAVAASQGQVMRGATLGM
jgi:hypothetical protein